jgi:hypothetical protein
VSSSARVEPRRYGDARLRLYRGVERALRYSGGRWIYRARHLARGRFLVREELVRVPGLHPSLSGFLVAQLSDFHAGPFLGRGDLRAVVEAVNELRPDVLALRLYLLGLPFAALDLLLVYAFYARQDTLTPALIGLLSLSVYMVVAVVLFPTYGLFSLMIADSVKHIIHALVSAYLLARRLRGFGRQNLWLTVLKAGTAAATMAIVAALLLPTLAARIGTTGLLREVLLVLASGGISVLMYLALAFLLRIEELRWLWRLIRQRLSAA